MLKLFNMDNIKLNRVSTSIIARLLNYFVIFMFIKGPIAFAGADERSGDRVLDDYNDDTHITGNAFAYDDSLIKDDILIDEEPLDTDDFLIENDVSDDSYYVYDTALSIANWVDESFGNSEALESASYNYLRMINQVSWREGEYSKYKPRVKAKVHLPKINRKYSLIFADEDSLIDSESHFSDNQASQQSVKNEREGAAALNIESGVHERYKFDTRIGLDSHVKIFAMLKHSFDVHESQNLSIRNYNYLFWRDRKGYGANFKFEVDRIIHETLFFRWGYSVLRAEKSKGNEWGNSFSLIHLHGGESLISYDVNMYGASEDPYDVEVYRLAVKYRRQLAVDWLFLEIEPEILWRRTLESDDREAVPGMIFRLEIKFER